MPLIVSSDDPAISKGGFVASRQIDANTFALYYSGEEIPPLKSEDKAPAIIVSPRQFLQALTRAGLRNTVETFVREQSQDVRDWYERATEFQSDHPMVVQMAALLGKDSDDVREVFALAETL